MDQIIIFVDFSHHSTFILIENKVVLFHRSSNEKVNQVGFVPNVFMSQTKSTRSILWYDDYDNKKNAVLVSNPCLVLK